MRFLYPAQLLELLLRVDNRIYPISLGRNARLFRSTRGHIGCISTPEYRDPILVSRVSFSLVPKNAALILCPDGAVASAPIPTAVFEKGVVRLQCDFQCSVYHMDTASFTKLIVRAAKDVFGTRHSQYDVKEPNLGRLFRLFQSEMSTFAVIR